jgi:PiT family inorganic phosphate transporter
MIEIAFLIVFLGLLFDYTNGFHDAANVVSTVIATRVLTPFAAIIMAGFLNMLGASYISGVAQTIATELVNSQNTPQIVVLCALCGAITWNFITWYLGIPSSSSYALIGGLIGTAWMYSSHEIVLWKGVLYKVIIPMIVTPIIGFILSYSLMKALFWIIKKLPSLKSHKLFAHLHGNHYAGAFRFRHFINSNHTGLGHSGMRPDHGPWNRVRRFSYYSDTRIRHHAN